MNIFKKELKMQANKNQEDEDVFKARIEFDGMNFLVYDCFEYKGEKYYYIIEDKSSEFNSEEDLIKFYADSNKEIRIEYIYEVDRNTHMYTTVTDEELLNELNIEETKRMMEGKI